MVIFLFKNIKGNKPCINITIMDIVFYSSRVRNFTKSFLNSSNPENALKYEAEVNAITAKDIQEVAKKYLTKDKVIGMLMPESKI
ncbi:MAG: hypothetical protein RIR36_600 [Bacteroidota bacterium]